MGRRRKRASGLDPAADRPPPLGLRRRLELELQHGLGRERHAGQTINLAEKEFTITPKTISVSKAGTYAFAVKNEGQTTHALEIEGNGVEQKSGDVSPGTSTTLTVNLSKAGAYEVYCPIDGHRQSGMQAGLTVG